MAFGDSDSDSISNCRRKVFLDLCGGVCFKVLAFLGTVRGELKKKRIIAAKLVIIYP